MQVIYMIKLNSKINTSKYLSPYTVCKTAKHFQDYLLLHKFEPLAYELEHDYLAHLKSWISVCGKKNLIKVFNKIFHI